MHNVEIFVRKAVGINKVLDIVDENDVPVDLSGYAIHWSAKAAPGAGSTVVAASTVDGRITVPASPAGRIFINVPHTEFSSVAAGAYVHDCVLIAPGGARDVLFGGNLTVAESITAP